MSGGTYEYGYRFLSPGFGFTAGALFLFAKSASAATATIGLGGDFFTLLVDGALITADATTTLPVRLAALFLAILGSVALAGIKPAFRLTSIFVALGLLAIAVFVVMAIPATATNFAGNFEPFFQTPRAAPGLMEILGRLGEATALMFVAYTGYGRIATLGEEVQAPARTIPRAVIITLTLSFAVYTLVALTSIGTAGAYALFAATRQQAAPLELVARLIAPGWLPLLVAIGALTAMAGVLLNLILGLSRIVLAMGRRGDLPRVFAHVNAAGSSPVPAVLAVLAVILILLLSGDVKFTWSFSAFFVLLYYAITNLCALRIPDGDRLYPRWLGWVGLVSCAVLALHIDWRAWLPGLAVLLALLGIYFGRAYFPRGEDSNHH